MEVIPVILAGGSGKRLWPLSRKLYPKQFLPLLDDNSVLQNTIERLKGINRLSKDLIVVCSEDHKFTLSSQLNLFKDLKSTIIAEPEPKNTAAATYIAAKHAVKNRKSKDVVLLVLPSDHMIGNEEEFFKCINYAIKYANEGKLVTLGIEPYEPSADYGYIQPETKGKSRISKIESFIEKPNYETAKDFFSSGNYLWNSGMFAFRADLFIDEMLLYAKEITSFCDSSYQKAEIIDNFINLDKDSFALCPSCPIDVALMEKTQEAHVVPFNASWSDIGNWMSYLRTQEKDSSGNYFYGDLISFDSKNSFIYSKDKLTTLLGVENLTIINTKDALLVASNEDLKNLSKVIEQLESSGRSEYKNSNKIYRPWGWYETIESGKNFQVKRISVLPFKAISLQKHNHRSEHWTLVKGSGQVTLGDETLVLEEDQSVYIPKGEIHRIENLSEDDIEFIEVQYGSYLEEDDIERFEDMFGRV